MSHPFPRPPRFKLKVKRSSAGLGLFADEDIPEGRFIIEYWGEVLPDDEAQEIGGKYLFELENGNTIVGTTRKNTARYANHSCKPNCESRTQGNRMFLWSIEPIKAGEEITYDYGEEYFEDILKPAGCRCEACEKTRKKSKAGR